MSAMGQDGCAPDVLALLNQAQAGEGGIVEKKDAGRCLLAWHVQWCPWLQWPGLWGAPYGAHNRGCGSFQWRTGSRHMRGNAWRKYFCGCKRTACRLGVTPAGAGTAGICRHLASAIPVHRLRTAAGDKQGNKSARGGSGVLAGRLLAAHWMRLSAVEEAGSGVDCRDVVAAPRMRRGTIARKAWRRAR
jgi:hypothetical protein